MTVLSDYMSGTISLANGSATVTGTGTLFEATKFREGDTLQIQNLTAVIASVDSDTQLTLTEPWTGLDIVDGAYRARQLGDGSRVSTQAATIIELLGNGVLMNLAELGVEEGKVPVGGPTGEYELVDKGQLGIQDQNGSLGKLAALTLAARQILQTDETGALKQVALAANKFLRTNSSADVSLGDLTDLGSALLALTGANGNIPVMTGVGTVASRPIVGTVSQAGGVPTGAIIERGSNANGEYVKYADGTLICTRSISYPNINITSASNGIFFGLPENARNFPAAFVTEPAFASIFLSGGIMWAVAQSVVTTTAWPGWYPFSDLAKTSVPAIAKYGAIGRWF